MARTGLSKTMTCTLENLQQHWCVLHTASLTVCKTFKGPCSFASFFKDPPNYSWKERHFLFVLNCKMQERFPTLSQTFTAESISDEKWQHVGIFSFPSFEKPSVRLQYNCGCLQQKSYGKYFFCYQNVNVKYHYNTSVSCQVPTWKEEKKHFQKVWNCFIKCMSAS